MQPKDVKREVFAVSTPIEVGPGGSICISCRAIVQMRFVDRCGAAEIRRYQQQPETRKWRFHRMVRMMQIAIVGKILARGADGRL